MCSFINLLTINITGVVIFMLFINYCYYETNVYSFDPRVRNYVINTNINFIV